MNTLFFRISGSWPAMLRIGVMLLGICSLFGEYSPALAQLHGGRGPLTVRSAWNLEPGYLTLAAHTRFYGKVAQIPGATLGSTIPTAIWDVQGGFALNYGISRHFEGSIAPSVYQDTNRGKSFKEFNLPDDLFLRMKIASFGQRGGAMSYGVELGCRIPTGDVHNVPFQPYATGRFSFGAIGLASYARDPLYPEDALNVHFNLGYWNHNDVGEQLSSLPLAQDSSLVTAMTQEIMYGVAMVLPSERFNFRFEIFGNGFINAPPNSAYSREPVAYFSPGVSYKAYRWMSLDFNTDIRLTGDQDKTTYAGLQKLSAFGLPNYPSWRATFGVKLTLLPTSLYSASERDLLMRKAESRRELFEQIIKEQRETESAEAELERIKDERRKAERELDRLRRILEGEARRQQEESGNGESEGSQPPR
jgi:hypothetical protein